MEKRSVGPNKVIFTMVIIILSAASVLYTASTFGLFSFGFMGLYVFPIYTIAKSYIFLPLAIAFYLLVWLWRKRTDYSRKKFCLIISTGAAIMFAAIGVILLREINIISMFGAFLGVFVPVFLSTYLMTIIFEARNAR